MTLRDSFNAAVSRLTVGKTPSPRLNAESLLMFTLGCDRAYLYAHPERELTAEETTRYDSALSERARGVPTQYITGHQEFWGMDFIVSHAVLIPRPETEHVIETVLKLTGRDMPGDLAAMRRKNAAHSASRGLNIGSGQAPKGRKNILHSANEDLRIVDVGTGSGCIALALAKELPHAEIYATDISATALEVARANAARHQMGSRIQFHDTDLLQGFEPSSFDFVISNPPYVGESEEDQVQMEVRKFEPRNAVFAGPSGLEVIERLIPQAQGALKPDGWLVMEISGTIAERVRELMGEWNEVQITNDLQGVQRVVSAKKP